jgi:NADPH:quinone reductase-like Zn-dependent oxidoreductase
MLRELAEKIASVQLPVQIGKVFRLGQIVDAQSCMEENKTGGKIVMLT